MAASRKLRMGMVGGGPGAFIGPVHRLAAEMDGKIEMVAGAFSQSAERSREAGERFKINPARAYADYRQMIEAELKRPDPIDFVVITTPNHLHLPIAQAALEAGIPVMSDKPATATYAEAQALEAIVAKSGLPYGLTHTYAGYALVREARHLCASGNLGKIRKVAVEYFQGWMSKPIENTGHKQAAWRADPAQNGQGGAIGDIGTHAFHLLEYISGLQVTEINATLRSVVEGRRLDDDCNAFVRLSNGATGTLACSQVAAGDLNEVRIRIYGETASSVSTVLKKFIMPVHRTSATMRSPSCAFRPAIPRAILRPSQFSTVNSLTRSLPGSREAPARCRQLCPVSSQVSAACALSTALSRATISRPGSRFK